MLINMDAFDIRMSVATRCDNNPRPFSNVVLSLSSWPEKYLCCTVRCERTGRYSHTPDRSKTELVPSSPRAQFLQGGLLTHKHLDIYFSSFLFLSVVIVIFRLNMFQVLLYTML